MRVTRRFSALAGAAGLLAALGVPLQTQTASAAPQLIQDTGGGVAAAVATFQAALGGANNGTSPPPANGGFRQINWDGVPVTGANAIISGEVGDVDTNLFQKRGVILSDDNAVSSNGFLNTNPNVGVGQFPAFSSPKVFAPYNDNQVEVNFVFASDQATTLPVPAATKGFGAVFEDVETASATSIEYFKGTTSLRKDFVPVGGAATQVFMGVVFDSPVVTRVVITLGTARIFDFSGGPTSPGGAESTDDLVTADDFIYGEPTCSRTIGAVTSPTVFAGDGEVVCLNGTTVNGTVNAGPNSVVLVNNAYVAGSVVANSAGFLSVCGSTVRGSVTAQSTSGFVRIGDAANDDNLGCGGNNVRGNVSVLSSQGGFEVGGNQIASNLTANDNGALEEAARTQNALQLAGEEVEHEVEGNTVGGNLTCLRNRPAVSDDEKPNTVTGAVNCVMVEEN